MPIPLAKIPVVQQEGKKENKTALSTEGLWSGYQNRTWWGRGEPTYTEVHINLLQTVGYLEEILFQN